MKIRTENQQPAAAEQAAGKQAIAKGVPKEAATPQKEGAAPRKGGAPKRQDSVELSAALDAELGTRQVEQDQRVAELKSRVASGEYRVDPRAVAEKILSGRPKK